MDLVGIVFYPVQDCFGQGAVVSAKLVIPAAVVVLRAEDGGGLFPSGVEQFQNVMLLHLRGLQQEPFVQDQESWVCVFHERFSVVVLRSGNLQIQQKIREPDVFGLKALLAGFHAQGAGHISLSASCSAGNEDVPVLRNVFAGRQSLNHRPVQLPAGGVVNVGNVGFGLVEGSALNEPLQAQLKNYGEMIARAAETSSFDIFNVRFIADYMCMHPGSSSVKKLLTNASAVEISERTLQQAVGILNVYNELYQKNVELANILAPGVCIAYRVLLFDDGDLLHDLCLERLVSEISCSSSYLVNDLYSLYDLAECGILSVEVRSVLMHDEEL